MYKRELINHLINENNLHPETVNKMTNKELVNAYIKYNDGIKSYEEFIIIANAVSDVEIDKIDI